MEDRLEPMAVYEGSNPEKTRAYYKLLDSFGPAGELATALFRAQKCSARAKRYRGGVRGVGSYRGMAYERKQWSMGEVCRILMAHSEALGIRFGWKKDETVLDNHWVLYVDLPTGQVSFHSPTRGDGPDYPGEWDRKRESAPRILEFCGSILSAKRKEPEQGALYDEGESHTRSEI